MSGTPPLPNDNLVIQRNVMESRDRWDTVLLKFRAGAAAEEEADRAGAGSTFSFATLPTASSSFVVQVTPYDLEAGTKGTGALRVYTSTGTLAGSAQTQMLGWTLREGAAPNGAGVLDTWVSSGFVGAGSARIDRLTVSTLLGPSGEPITFPALSALSAAVLTANAATVSSLTATAVSTTTASVGALTLSSISLPGGGGISLAALSSNIAGCARYDDLVAQRGIFTELLILDDVSSFKTRCAELGSDAPGDASGGPARVATNLVYTSEILPLKPGGTVEITSDASGGGASLLVTPSTIIMTGGDNSRAFIIEPTTSSMRIFTALAYARDLPLYTEGIDASGELYTLLTVSAATISSLTSFKVEADTILTLSDERVKKDIEDVIGAMSIIKALRPVFYNRVDTANAVPGYKELGFLASQVQTALPQCVFEDRSSPHTLKRLQYDRMTAILTAGLQEQAAQVDVLTVKVSTLEACLSALVASRYTPPNPGIPE